VLALHVNLCFDCGVRLARQLGVAPGQAAGQEDIMGGTFRGFLRVAESAGAESNDS